MDTQSAYSSYKRYKSNTDAVAAWLLTTAKKHGCRAYDSNDGTPAALAAAPRLKGKSRKLAREADAAAAKQAQLRPAAYRIEIKDFIQLAQHIAKSTKPRIKVPDYFVRDLQQAIKMRKSHQAWYVRFSNETNSAAADQGHTHFIQTLEAVRELLRPNMPEGFPSKPAQNEIDTKECQLSNIFEHLTVEEPSETGNSTTDTRREEAVENISVTVSDAVDDEKQEAFIASVYLSRDSHGFLEDLREVWTSYQQGRIDLVAAAITTNTAIEFCRKLQEEFEATFPKQQKSHELGCLYCVHLRATKREGCDSKYRIDTCLMTARGVLSRFIDQIRGHPADVALKVTAERLPLYMGGSDRSVMDMEERFDQDFDLAMGILPEFFELVHAQPRVQAEHELFRGLRHVVTDKEQPFWLTFAFQVYLDIRHILRENVDRGFKDLCRGAQPIADSIDRILTLNRQTDLHTAVDKSMKHLSATIGFWTKHDQVGALVGQRSMTLDPSTTQQMPPNYHLERDPLWCGLLLYNFRTAAHQGAVFTANASNFILATAHLYNSLRQTGILPCEWPDMERLIAMHRAKNLFVGDLPTTFTNSMKSFGLVIGLPTSILAKNPRLHTSNHRVSKSRKSLGLLAPTLLRFKTGICDGEGRGAHGPEDIQAYIRQKILAEARDGSFNSAVDASGASGILRSLPFLLQSEDSELTFDHYEMHIVCWKLLRGLHAALGKSLDGWAEVYQDDRVLSGIVLLLLTEWAERENVAEALGLDGKMTSMPTVSTVKELLESLIASEGDVASSNMSDPGAFALPV
jgi:hypothetical protein